MGSAWRCTIFHSPFSRRKIVVLRSVYGVGSEPRTDAVVRSIASRYAKSSPTSAATTSHSHERQFEKFAASFDSGLTPCSGRSGGRPVPPRRLPWLSVERGGPVLGGGQDGRGAPPAGGPAVGGRHFRSTASSHRQSGGGTVLRRLVRETPQPGGLRHPARRGRGCAAC